jgi:DNA-binding MurR/RpiR family transcriptional regulator
VANRILLKSAPATIEALRVAMQEHYGELSARLQQVAQLLMREPHVVATDSSRQLAAGLGVPQSTLTRFAKVMGYADFKSVQALFKEQYVLRPRDYLQRVKGAQTAAVRSPHPLPAPFLDLSHAVENAVQTTAMELTADKLHHAATLLRGASEIWVHGVRRAYPVAVYLQYLLLKLGLRTSLLDQGGGLLDPALARLHRAGVLLVVTYSPHAAETEQVIAAARAAGVTMVAITDPLPHAPAKDMAVRFEIREGEVMGFRSLSASMFVALALALELARSIVHE